METFLRSKRAARLRERPPSAPTVLLTNARDMRTVRDTVSEQIVPHRLTVPAGARLDVVLRRIYTGAFSVFTLAYGCPVELRLEGPRQSYLVLLAGAPSGVLRTGSEAVPLTPAVLGPDGQAVLRWPAGAWVTLLVVPRRTLERAAPTHWYDSIQFQPHMDASPDAAGSWLALARTFLNTAAGSPIAQSPEAMAGFEQLLIHGLLASQANSVQSGAAPDFDHLPPQLLKAIEFCAKPSGVPPSVTQIAAVAHMSVRTLQTSFQKHLGVSPNAYLRSVRLAHVHRELLAGEGDSSGRTVTQIARHHGFHHLGRFARVYRAQYGQMPSETLRAGARSPGTAPAQGGPRSE